MPALCKRNWAQQQRIEDLAEQVKAKQRQVDSLENKYRNARDAKERLRLGKGTNERGEP